MPDPFDDFDKHFRPGRLAAYGVGAVLLNLALLAGAVAVVIVVIKALV